MTSPSLSPQLLHKKMQFSALGWTRALYAALCTPESSCLAALGRSAQHGGQDLHAVFQIWGTLDLPGVVIMLSVPYTPDVASALLSMRAT